MFPTVDLEATTLTPLFEPGQAIATLGAQRAMRSYGIDHRELLSRHLIGDFGFKFSDKTVAVNRLAIKNGGPVSSCYEIDGLTYVWVITHENREFTKFMLSGELRAELDAEKALLTDPAAIKAPKQLSKKQPCA